MDIFSGRILVDDRKLTDLYYDYISQDSSLPPRYVPNDYQIKKNCNNDDDSGHAPQPQNLQNQSHFTR